MKRRFFVTLFITLTAAVAGAAEYKVIVHESNRTTTLSRKDVSAMFMKKTAKWTDGKPVTPVDQPAKASVRNAFSRDVHGRPSAAVDSFWHQQIFSGREVPPLIRSSDSEVVAFVRANPGAIGYVTDSAAVSGVRTIEVTQ